MAQQNPRGVQVDSDARRANDPVTVVVWPSGLEQDADTWSDATVYQAMGAGIKDGYPSEPEMVLNEDSEPAPGNEPPDGGAQRTPPPAAPRPVAPSPSPAPTS